MGLESASMRQCLLWFNFIVWGMRTAGPKTQTDPWYGGFSMLLETAMCVCEFGLDVLFFSSRFVCRPFERCEQRGEKPSLMLLIRREVGRIQLINRTIKAITESLTLRGFMQQNKQNDFTPPTISVYGSNRCRDPTSVPQHGCSTCLITWPWWIIAS